MKKCTKKERSGRLSVANAGIASCEHELRACEKSLTQQQLVLVHEYMVDMNFSAAMLRAGYKNVSNATRLKETPNIKNAIGWLLQERRNTCRFAADKALAHLVRVLDLSVDDFLVWEGTSINLKPMADVPQEKRAMLVEWKQTGGRGFSIKLPDKLVAIDKIMRHLGMFEKSSRRGQPLTERQREILMAVRDGELTVDAGLLTLDAEGIPIPESLRLLASRKKGEDGPQADGSCCVVSPEEMAAKRKAAIKSVQRQREEFLPQRREEVKEIKEEVGGGSIALTLAQD